jgi:hypothetical protein
MAVSPSGKAKDCKSFIPQFKSECRLIKKNKKILGVWWNW